METPDCYETWSWDDCLTRDPPCPFAFKCETAYLQKIEDEKQVPKVDTCIRCGNVYKLIWLKNCYYYNDF